ncbi:MAG: hypothetical protein ACI9S8_001127, partial [Chlamydiales bacterium]
SKFPVNTCPIFLEFCGIGKAFMSPAGRPDQSLG